jgi:hypothetical protein
MGLNATVARETNVTEALVDRDNSIISDNSANSS